MSTEIKTINGRCESGKYDNSFPIYTNATISLTRFAGGIRNGHMIQLTIQDATGHAYIQLTKVEIQHLKNVLEECFNYTKYPSD